MQKLTISCLAFLAVVCLYANSVSAIKCNQCKDPTDKKCSDTKSVDCDKGDDTCITMTITQGDSTEINKGCGNSPKDNLIYHLEGCFDTEETDKTPVRKAHICGCQSDNCNSAHSITSVVALVFAVFALLGAKLVR